MEELDVKGKYYIPTLEEFHIGFECEMLEIETWVKGSIMLLDPVQSYRKQIAKKIIRVKYLDKEDIESLGFVYDTYFRDGGTSVFNMVDKGYTLYFYRTNTTLDNSNRIKILNNTGPLYRGCLFDGDIKNKSELVKLLKQLGI